MRVFRHAGDVSTCDRLHMGVIRLPKIQCNPVTEPIVWIDLTR